MRPRVAIGMPVYNGENYLAAAIDSVLAQTHRDLELILCDNASTDSTPGICEKYARSDARVRYVRNEQNIGAAPNFNRCFELADSPYFKWAAHDDVLEPTYVEKCLARLDADPTMALCHSFTAEIDERGNRLGEYVSARSHLGAPRVSERFRRLLWTENCTEIFGLMRTSMLKRTNLHGSYVGSDRNLLAELLLLGTIGYVEEYLFLRRNHPDCYCRKQKDDAARLKWFDPKVRKARATGVVKARHYARAIGRMPGSWLDRSRCYGELAAWVLVRSVQKPLRRGAAG
jgi:glycosyltransferase involved in cell wall biosynthesis